MADLIAIDFNSPFKFYRWTAETTTVNSSFAYDSIDTIGRGVDWDGTDVVWSGSQAGKGYRGTGFGLTIQASYSTGSGSSTRGITWDGTDAMDEHLTQDKWRKRTGFTATVQSSFIVGTAPLGGSWHISGADLFTIDISASKSREHSGFSATITTSYSSGGWSGITANTSDEHIDAKTGGEDKVRKRDNFTSTITSSWSPTEGSGRVDIAWDGRFAAAGLDFQPLFNRSERTYLRM